MALEGTTLKGWELGKKLGSGACSDVYEVEPVSPLNDKKCDAFVMKISPLVVIDAAKAKNKKRKKSAAERNADALYAEHLMYQSHLREHQGLPYIPHGGYGEDKGYRFLVMERLGRTLEDVLRDNGPIPSATAAQLGLNLLDTLQYIHSKNIVYVDVKPENFMLDRGKESRVYFVDFGIADRYIMATGKHKENKIGTIVGTPTFLSVNCHAGATASRRDDVEALIHVLIYLVRGDLPWQNAKSDAEGAKSKKETSIQTLCASLPGEWAEMLDKARQLEFEDKPDYDYFHKQFVKLGAKVGSSDAFDWGRKKTKGQLTPTPSPVRKKSKGQETTSSPAEADILSIAEKPKVTTNAKVKGANSGAKQIDETTSRSRASKTTAKNSAPRAKTSKKAVATKVSNEEAECSGSENEDSDGVEFVKATGNDPRRRRKAAAKAVAAAAAAQAAAKQAESVGRYDLRSAR